MLKTLADMVRHRGDASVPEPPRGPSGAPACPPLLAGQWHDVEPGDALTLMVRAVARVDQLRRICSAHDVIAVRSRPLISVNQGILIEFDTIDDAGQPAGCGAFVYRPGLIDPLDGLSARLHGLADEAALLLDTPEQALEYCQLFAAAVQGGDGCFFPFPSDMPVTVLNDHPCAARSLQTAREPFRARKVDGGWEVTMTVAYSSGLFRAVFRLVRSGMIEMIDDRYLCGIAPVTAQSWMEGLRVTIPVAAADDSIGCSACPLGHDNRTQGE